ncbi:hypothetical protein B9Q02_09820 [Candidatus Marsarchaeota G1 archaeon BE_D]|jgi:hypothetical protein|uniref:PrgI family protein n=1 Tax=Candidatus Marsarchaeota G1 archaeon BE_D TaxID=1978156 RepID=A0A2R6ACI8_9ARCH|nr:MAG: hypothetical protein B9Q02_09820 [Candidatus Marsarchaeota G1 archaeon BE_D]
MRRFLEVVVLDEISILDERLNLGAWGGVSLRALGYLLIGSAVAYPLFRTGFLPNEVIAVIALFFCLALGFYPARAYRLESLLVAMLRFYLARSRGTERPPQQKRKERGGMERRTP